MAEAPKAEIVDLPVYLLDHHKHNEQQQQEQQQEQRKNQLFWKLSTLACVVVAAVLVVIIIAVSQRQDDAGKGSSNLRSSSSTSSSPTSSPTTASSSDDDVVDDYTHVYVISTKIKNYCGHEMHTAQKCGGHLASITTPQEKQIVDHLKDLAISIADDANETSWDLPIQGVWIGGIQSVGSWNDTGSTEEDAVWSWSDYSPWFDGSSTTDSYWARDEPNNQIEVYLNRSKGEHYVMLSREGRYIDESGCFGETAPRGPGIYILPKGYRDFNRYPDCTPGSFLIDQQIPVPPRVPAEWVYVLKQKYQYVCGKNDTSSWNGGSPANCGGYLASITNLREKAIVDQLKDLALEQAEKDGQPNVTGVWIGGMQSFERRKDQGPEQEQEQEEDEKNTSTSWFWHDGSPWFDNHGKYWEDGQPDNTIHHLTNPDRQRGEHFVMLNANGQYEDVLDCSMGRGPILPSIFLLPADYADRTKYIDCQQGDFTTVIPAPPRGNHK